MRRDVYTLRLNNGFTAPCDCNYVSSVEGTIVGYTDLRGALRFSTEHKAEDEMCIRDSHCTIRCVCV